jgi:ribosome silencing factor RsfS/YbeB/iojap
MEQRIKKIVDVLDSKKAEEIEVIDLEGKGYITNTVIIATALNSRHSIALLSHLKNELKPEEEFVATEEDGEWTIVDLGDIIIHLMTQTHRDIYSLEEFLSTFPLDR